MKRSHVLYETLCIVTVIEMRGPQRRIQLSGEMRPTTSSFDVVRIGFLKEIHKLIVLVLIFRSKACVLRFEGSLCTADKIFPLDHLPVDNMYGIDLNTHYQNANHGWWLLQRDNRIY